MNINGIKITAIAKILILILLMLTGYFIWLIFPRSTKPISYKEPIYKSVDEMPPLKNPPAGEKLNIPTLPVPKPDLEILFKEKILPTLTVPFFENIYKAAKPVETKLKNEIAAPTQAIPSSSSITLSLTNDEFHFLYPDSFIASLIGGQNLFIKSYDPAYEPLLKIETDPQVRFVEEKIVAALLSINMITKEEAEQFITTIRFTLPQLQIIELKNRKSSTLFPWPSSTGLFFAGLLERFFSALIPKSQAAPCGACYTTPECYRPGASPPTPGFNIWKPFCYCTGCYYGQGCLDFFGGSAAIWDPTTGLCGGG